MTERRWNSDDGRWPFGGDYSEDADHVFVYCLGINEPAWIGPVDVSEARYRRLVEAWAEYFRGEHGECVSVDLFYTADGNKELDGLLTLDEFREVATRLLTRPISALTNQ